MIFNIQRFSIHDGPGIRTSVFLKGCPLRCAWCHNPEGLKQQQQISFIAEKCILCGACAAVCTQGIHQISPQGHDILWNQCRLCGACVNACGYNALEIIGKVYSVEEVVNIAKRDKLFYSTNGGVTLTGGEPMAQAEFSLALAQALTSEGIKVCMETSGYCDQAALADMTPWIDCFLFDIKDTDEERHRLYTGVGLDRIQKNLRFLDDLGAKLILRCPLIPGINDRETHLDAIAKMVDALSHVFQIELEPYHPMGISKLARIGTNTTYENKCFMDKSDSSRWGDYLRGKVKVPVIVR